MSVVNSLSVIPFYDSREKQDFRKWGDYGNYVFPIVPSGSLVPFFLNVDSAEYMLIDIYDCEDRLITPPQVPGSLTREWSSFFIANGLVLDEGLGMVVYPANGEGITLGKGIYYIKISFPADGYEYYSEAFQVGDVSDLMRIEWYNQEDLKVGYDKIPYGQYPTFKNILYLDSKVGYPSYQTSEEGEDRDGLFFPIKQLSWKRYSFVFAAPSYICDSLRLAFLADRVKIVSEGEEYYCDTFTMTPSALEQQHYASVVCEFTADTIVKMIGKAYTTIQNR